MKGWPIRLATLVAVGLGLFLALRLQPWSLLTVHNVGSTPLSVDIAFQGVRSVTGVLKPGERRFGRFRIDGEAGMDFACRAPGRPLTSSHIGYYMNYQPYIVALDLKDCDVVGVHEVLIGPL